MEHNFILQDVKKIDDIELEHRASADCRYVINGYVPLYSIDMDELNKWYKKWLKDLKSFSDYGTEAFELAYPEQTRGTVLDAIEKYVVETLDLKEILKNFSYGNDSFKIVHRTTHLYSVSIGFELEIGDVAPF